MSWLNTIAGRLGFERRSADPSWAALTPGLGLGAAMSARAAENISAVFACTSAISSALAYIPALVYRRDGKGNRVEQFDHPLVALTRQGVNDQMTWPEFVEHFVASALLNGNGLAEVRRDRNGALIGLEFIPWSRVSVEYLSTGRLAYDVSDPFGRGRAKRLLQSEVLHLRDRSDDGLIGRSRLSRASETVAGVAAANTFAKGFLDRGGYPSGIITYPGVMNPEDKAAFARDFAKKHAGAQNVGRILVLDQGLTWTTAAISPEDAELLESRKFGVEEICRLFQVPPPLVQDYSHNTFTNSETAGRWFAQFTLAPWARKLEAEFARSIFSPASGFELELDLSAFLRGDPKTRWDAHKIAVETGVLDPDEVRHVEGWNPRAKPELTP
ncbi:phage portal protein [Sphingobium sp. MK2]|uniref:phage portal protein n=1 Tax=Sphingobium sp. MK2 TaxID=3116540 RepID=UPI0032E357BD